MFSKNLEMPKKRCIFAASKMTTTMKKILLSTLFLLTTAVAAQAEGEKFAEFQRIYATNGVENDSAYMFLEQWAKEEPNNAEQLYCHGIYHYLLARPQIEYTEDLKEFEHTAMLPACERFGQLQITCYWIMKDHGDGMEHYVKAHECYKKALEVQPNNIELYSNLTEFYLWKYETRYATSLALDLLDMHQADSTRWTDFYGHPFPNAGAVVEEHMNMLLGDLIQKGEISLAGLLCDSLLSRYPDNLIYRFDKGVVMLNSFKPDDATAHFEQMLVDYPQEGNVIHALASLYSQKGDTENARKYATLLSQHADPQWALAGQQLLASLEPFVIDFHAIEDWMKEHADEYKALETRFVEGDPSLTNLELSRIYFGHALTDQCQGVVLTDVDLKALIDAEDYATCLAESRKILEQHPASIAAMYYVLVSSFHIESEIPKAEIISPRFSQIVEMIRKDAEDSLKTERQEIQMGHKYYKILWRADEDVFVELLPEEERGKTSFFSNPVYFR